jgi:Ribbon-helix-helix domain
MTGPSKPDPSVLMALFAEPQPANSDPPQFAPAKALDALADEAWGATRRSSKAAPAVKAAEDSKAEPKPQTAASAGRKAAAIVSSADVASRRLATRKAFEGEDTKVTSVRLYPSLVEPLRRLSFETRATQTELLNEALVDLFAKYQALGLDLGFLPSGEAPN